MRLRLIAPLIAAAAMAAAPAMADDKSSRWIRVQSMPLGGSMAKGDNYDHGWIEIQGWDWEAPPRGPFKGEIVGIEPTYEQSATAKARRPVGTSDLTMKRGTSPAPSRPTAPPEPDRFLDYDEGDTGTHQATGGNRTLTVHGTRTEGPAGPDKFGRVKVKFAWDGCARGLRLPSIELRDARMLFLLEDLIVVDCSAGSATFAYTGLRRSGVR